jgi:Uma2 family endonuclease
MTKAGRAALDDYLAGPESLTPAELIVRECREAPAPYFGHQSTVGNAFRYLDAHVRAHALGRVCISPLDVVLDADLPLVLQPDLLFVSRSRLPIIRNQIWGAPDLVVEVESRGSLRHDRIRKRRWYGEYGVREYWLLDPAHRTVRVIGYESGESSESSESGESRTFGGVQPVVSALLPGFSVRADLFFE